MKYYCVRTALFNISIMKSRKCFHFYLSTCPLCKPLRRFPKMPYKFPYNIYESKWVWRKETQISYHFLENNQYALYRYIRRYVFRLDNGRNSKRTCNNKIVFRTRMQVNYGLNAQKNLCFEVSFFNLNRSYLLLYVLQEVMITSSISSDLL